jgi:pyruvate/2-oxoglutarate dehydrogenase complex dihydrolipoamide acyltransferase (E2) component
MPQMGVSVAEGTVTSWHKQVGDWVEADETICEITTDKIDIEVPSPASGRVLELLVAEEQTVPVGAALARIATDATAGEAHPAEELEREPGYSPVVARIAAEHGIDLAHVKGTGRGGRVRKQDVLAAVGGEDVAAQPPTGPPPHTEAPPPAEARPQATPSPPAGAPADGAPPGEGPPGEVAPPGARPPGEVAAPAAPEGPKLHTESPYRAEDERASTGAPPARGGEPLSRMRRAIAEHMSRSLHTAAHCTTIVEVDMSAVEQARARAGSSPLPYVARAVIDALQEHPALNATLEDEFLTRHRDVNLGIAVSLGQDGLIVPVIHRAQQLSAEGLADRIAELARRARGRELSPDEVRGGTFTITNPGSYGSLASTPIINQPQVAILDLEAVTKRPVAIACADGSDAIAIRPMTYLCLSWDHRALDGAQAARFLVTVRERIEES